VQTQEEAAVLISGAFGSGKSTVAEELVDLIEQRGLPYALMDLDFLAWYSADHDDEKRVLRQNVEALAANFRAAGVRLFVLAWAVQDRATVDALSQALGIPLRVVRLTVPAEEIERRLRASASTEARLRDDLPRAAEQIAAGAGEGIEDLAVANEGSPREVAAQIARWLGWA
jgi:chloramphenicol 3-O-phosphotransferase